MGYRSGVQLDFHPAPVAAPRLLNRASIVVSDTSRATAVLKDANGNVLTGQTVSDEFISLHSQQSRLLV
jgi:hypothetical protein